MIDWTSLEALTGAMVDILEGDDDPEILKHCTAAVANDKDGKHRGQWDAARKICQGSLSKSGHMRKGDLTSKGRKANIKHKTEPGGRSKSRDFDRHLDTDDRRKE